MRFHIKTLPEGRVEVRVVPKHRPDGVPYSRDEEPDEVLMTLQDRCNDAEILQLRALICAHQQYSIDRTQNRGYTISPKTPTTKEDENYQLAAVVSTIAGPNVIRARVSPMSIVPYVRPRTTKVSPLLSQVLDQYLQKTRNAVPKIAVDNAWISTGNANGVVTNLRAMCRDHLDFGSLPEYLESKGCSRTFSTSQVMSRAVVRLLYRHGWRSDQVIDPPEITYDFICGQRYPWQKSGGVVLSQLKVVPANDLRIKYGPGGLTKDQLFASESWRCYLLWERFIEAMRNGQFYPDLLPINVAKISEKPEVRQLGDDPTKVRLFFIVSFMNIILGKILHTSFFKFTRTRGMNAIGTQWGAGDAERFAQKHFAYTPGRRYIHLDFSKLDQTLTWFILCLVSFLSTLSYNQKHPFYSAVKAMLAYLCEQLAIKFVLWPDGTFRVVFGCMFSGAFETSQIDTMCVALCWEMFFLVVEYLIRHVNPALADQFLDDLKAGLIAIDIYGDDVILSFPDRYAEWINLNAISDFFLKVCRLLVKHSASGECTSFFTVVDYATGTVLVPGPVFLKRRFIRYQTRGWNRPVTMCWRPAEDYYVRAIVSANYIKDPRLALARFHALMLDTHGTNAVAWDFLEKLCDIIEVMFPGTEDRLSRSPLTYGGDDPELWEMTQRVKKSGYPLQPGETLYSVILRRPRRDDVLSKFVPNGDCDLRQFALDHKVLMPYWTSDL